MVVGINLYPNGVKFNSPGSAQRHPGLKDSQSRPALKGSYKYCGWVARPEQRDGRGERGEDVENETKFNSFDTFRPRPSSTQGVPPKLENNSVFHFTSRSLFILRSALLPNQLDDFRVELFQTLVRFDVEEADFVIRDFSVRRDQHP